MNSSEANNSRDFPGNASVVESSSKTLVRSFRTFSYWQICSLCLLSWSLNFFIDFVSTIVFSYLCVFSISSRDSSLRIGFVPSLQFGGGVLETEERIFFVADLNIISRPRMFMRIRSFIGLGVSGLCRGLFVILVSNKASLFRENSISVGFT